jgi:hypothetical protein
MTNTISILDVVGSTATLSALRKAFNKDPSRFHAHCRDTVIKPRMEIINKTSGQENDPDFMAYVVEHWLNQNP